MEKVKITKEQADAIEFALNESEDFKDNPDRLFRDCIASHVSFHSELYALNNLDVVKLAKVLFVPNGYEVEPEFKVGDWVYVKGIFKSVSPEIAKVTDVKTHRMILDNGFDLGKGSITSDTVRHATPKEIEEEKERRWWDKQGRKPWELKQGDIVTNGYETKRYLGKCQEGKNIFTKNTWDEKRDINEMNREHFSTEHVRKYYEVLCFAEDRKDVAHAE